MRFAAFRRPRTRSTPGFLLLLLLTAAGCATPSAPVRSVQVGTAPPPASGQVFARGLATYYGPGYQGRPTASGERFDKQALTAAHATLPFGRRVRVTNQENGRSVDVRINDRFRPFKGRIIDLSEGAFRQIAPLERGVIPVTVEILP